jgi:methyl-accepting chemotaxis protein
MMAHMKEASVRLAGGDFDIEVPLSGSSDEIGAFEHFFADFLGTVSNTIKQLLGK